MSQSSWLKELNVLLWFINIVNRAMGSGCNYQVQFICKVILVIVYARYVHIQKC